MDLTWSQLTAEMVFDSGFRKIERRRYRFPDGREADYDIKLDPKVVTILAFTEDRQVIIARQFRPGPGKVLCELPGGAVDVGETPEAAAQRELLEETGFSGDLHFIGQTFSGAYSTMQRYNFVALNCRKVQQAQTEANEFIEQVELSLVDFRELLRSGQLSDVATGYMGLDYLGWL